jgi:hypothetical protein
VVCLSAMFTAAASGAAAGAGAGAARARLRREVMIAKVFIFGGVVGWIGVGLFGWSVEQSERRLCYFIETGL